ncbi:activating signal cointegrator 1 complex subunit [Dermatophagoides farinae]|uniref:Activating signal cointegrator 1 complex subunit n=2 Tax=Dermatophagoides farinae TaxID=6954 RepID=A0A922L921_DERFA|nr:activating signal cointegrator 1 complex subunit 1-like [Dermatophagoides farinae]KAH9527064.1 activating signal cointegrator 1 complex subunit [Dermatophagoides farinae]
MIMRQASTMVKNRFTHLITIPFVNDDFIQAYLDFKHRILEDNPDIDEILFQNPKKLHMTISCLSLDDQQRLTMARELFTKQCSDYVEKFPEILDNKIQIKGVDIMNENPRKTNVLYAKIENENLQNFANNIADVMVSNGFLYTGDRHANLSGRQNVKLHLTLMNSSFLFRRKDFSLKKRKPMKQRYFDSTEILNNYRDHFFMEIPMPPVQLNELHRINEFGYYNVVESIHLLKQ